MEGEQKRKSSLMPFWIIAIGLVGFADALYLSWNKLRGTLPTCSIVHGCDVVLTSKYATVLGVPLAYLGLVFYAYLLLLAILLAYDAGSRGLRLGMLLYGAAGLLCSIGFIYIQIALIHAICMYCAISALTTLGVFVFALLHFRRAQS